MAEIATFSLDNEASDFLKKVGGNNKNAHINVLLKTEKQRQLEEDILRANQQEAEDEDYQGQLSEWDHTLSDGLN